MYTEIFYEIIFLNNLQQKSLVIIKKTHYLSKDITEVNTKYAW